MKRYIRSKTISPCVIDVEIIYYPLIGPNDADVAASLDLSSLNLPEGPVISGDRTKVTEQMKTDFKAFMIVVEKLCYQKGLIGTYKNVSDDVSHYYNYLATDKQGNIIIDYRMKLRVASHVAQRSYRQKEHKKEETKSEKLNDLLTPDEIDKLEKYTVEIRVNDTIFSSYQEAIQEVDRRLDHYVERMTKNAGYRKKVSVPERYKDDTGFDKIHETSEES